MEQLVQSNAIFFAPNEFPSPLLERLISPKVLIIGETHYSQEHQDLLIRLIARLQESNCRQLLLESNHAYSWLMEDYVLGQRSTVPIEARLIDHAYLEAIRRLNANLSADKRVRIGAIDMNHWREAFRQSLTEVEQQLGPQDLFRKLDGIRPDSDGYIAALREIQRSLVQNEHAYTDRWTGQWYTRVCELFEIEEASAVLRNKRDDGSANRREDVITRLVERRIAECPGQTVLNVGSNHAEKTLTLNTWSSVSSRLTRTATATRPAPYVVSAIPMSGHTKQWFGATESVQFDLYKSAPGNNLVAVLGRAAGDRMAFLPLDDPAFSNQQFQISFNWLQAKSASPKKVWDAFIVYPKASIIKSLAAMQDLRQFFSGRGPQSREKPSPQSQPTR